MLNGNTDGVKNKRKEGREENGCGEPNGTGSMRLSAQEIHMHTHSGVPTLTGVLPCTGRAEKRNEDKTETGAMLVLVKLLLEVEKVSCPFLRHTCEIQRHL